MVRSLSHVSLSLVMVFLVSDLASAYDDMSSPPSFDVCNGEYLVGTDPRPCIETEVEKIYVRAGQVKATASNHAGEFWCKVTCKISGAEAVAVPTTHGACGHVEHDFTLLSGNAEYACDGVGLPTEFPLFVKVNGGSAFHINCSGASRCKKGTNTHLNPPQDPACCHGYGKPLTPKEACQRQVESANLCQLPDTPSYTVQCCSHNSPEEEDPGMEDPVTEEPVSEYESEPDSDTLTSIFPGRDGNDCSDVYETKFVCGSDSVCCNRVQSEGPQDCDDVRNHECNEYSTGY